LFNLEAGLTRADDTLPERILKEVARSGSGIGQVSRLDEMLPEYYVLREWTDGGVPTPGVLERLGLGTPP
jgi:aldehyde:ferredoxin oxidoreductase